MWLSVTAASPDMRSQPSRATGPWVLSCTLFGCERNSWPCLSTTYLVSEKSGKRTLMKVGTTPEVKHNRVCLPIRTRDGSASSSLATHPTMGWHVERETERTKREREIRVAMLIVLDGGTEHGDTLKSADSGWLACSVRIPSLDLRGAFLLFLLLCETRIPLNTVCCLTWFESFFLLERRGGLLLHAKAPWGIQSSMS